MKFKIMLLLSAVLLAGCSTAGPFVTNISSDGKGNLIVEKGYAEFNSFVGVVGNKQAETSIIKVVPEK